MTWHEVNDDIVITLPENFDMNANLGYLTREKNECMYEIENDIITKVNIKMTVKKSEYIIGIARLMASGELSNRGNL